MNTSAHRDRPFPGPAAVLVAGCALGALLLAAPSLAARGEESEDASYLGVYLGDAVDGGVEIVAIVAGGPAAKAGLEIGDVIVEAGEAGIDTARTLGKVLERKSPGDTLTLMVFRDDGSRSVDVVLGSRRSFRPPAVPLRAAVAQPSAPAVPSSSAPPPPSARATSPAAAPSPLQSLLRPRGLGLQVAEITPALRVHYGAPAEAGVLVTRVGGVAADAGLRTGDVLVVAGGQPIRTRPQLESVLWTWDWQQPVVVDVVREGATVPVKLQLSRGEEETPFGRARELRRRALERERAALEDRLRRIARELEELSSDP